MNYSKLCARLPVGYSDFERLRKDGAIYVDKTELIYDLAVRSRKYFLTRPRRFGKSLLLSAIGSLFEHGLEHFRGLAIEKLWDEKAGYRVIRLDFSEIKNFRGLEDFDRCLAGHLADRFGFAGFEPVPGNCRDIIRQLSKWMQVQETGSCVLLIDEYDAPLTACLDNPSLFLSVRKTLQGFYAAVKANDGPWRLVFMTGITKFNQTGIFSEFNSLRDISLEKKYSALLGYTEDEIRKYFPEFVTYSARCLGLTERELLDRLAENYDGYCFDGFSRGADVPAQRVHAPWSVLSFFESPEDGFLNYWIQSGGKVSLLHQYLKSHALLRPEEYGKELAVRVDELAGSSDVSQIKDSVLLTQAGYLTVKRRAGDTLYVGYPNREVASSLAVIYAEALLAGKTLENAGVADLGRMLESGETIPVMERLNQAFASISYKSFPVRDEATCRGYALIFFRGAGYFAEAEADNMLGRSDLEFDAGDCRWVFEFKFLKKEDEGEEAAAELLGKACRQIRERMYGAASGRRLIRVGAVFSEAKRQFTAFADADEAAGRGEARA